MSSSFRDHGCIAFCFLTRELPLQSELWYEFFAEAREKGLPFVVVVHNKERISKASPAHTARHWFKERVCGRTVDTAWGNVSLVRATVEMWREAIRREPRVSHLCLLSESCIPLWGFAQIHRAVVCMPRTTFDARPRGESNDRFEHLKDQSLVRPEHRRKQAQWFVAARRDADWFLKNDFTARWGQCHAEAARACRRGCVASTRAYGVDRRRDEATSAPRSL